MNAKDLWTVPLAPKLKILEYINAREFNNTVQQSMTNEDATEVLADLVGVDPSVKPTAPLDSREAYCDGLV